jgi:hypothetical protein
MWEKIPMDDRPCIIIEERRNPPMGEQRAVTIWRRDTHRDNPVTMEESAYGEQRAVTIWRRDTHKDNPVTMEESAYGEQRAVTI